NNAALWCEKVAEDHPKLAVYYKMYQRHLDRDAEVPSDPRKIFDMAYKFDTGHGAKRNEALAVKWYLRAARLGYAPAQRNVAGMYGSGRGADLNHDTARHWFLLAAMQGDAQAQFVIGKHYSTSEPAAMEWLWK